jgi:hypothetical protein
MTRQDLDRGVRIGWRVEVGGEWLPFEAAVPLER